MRTAAWSIFLTAFLASCAPAEDTDNNSQAPAFGTVKDTFIGVCKDAWGALQTPLVDLNLKRQKIPEKLQGCAANPYAMPLPPLCFNINKELAELDALLGPDMEPQPLPWLPPPETEDHIQQGMKQVPSLAREHAVGMVQSKANVIPFRGMVRKITGAEKHAQAVADAYEAGRLRRAFLKGLARAYHCPPLAPPLIGQ